MEHSPIGGSGLYRIRACPGSVRLTRDLPDSSSVYAAEGTAAHEVLEHCLTGGFDADHFTGAGKRVDGFDIEVTEEMTDAVQVAVDYIRSRCDVEKDVIHVETRFDLGHLYPNAGGTADVVVYKPDEKRLIVMDYKHGRGVPVEVGRNDQLMFYGLGAAVALPDIRFRTMELVVLQPRCEHPDGPIRSWETDSIDVLEFAGEVKEISELANSDDAPLAAGDHCRFCKASGTCPELRDSAFRAAKTEFNKVDNLKGADPAEFSRKEIGEILDAADVLDQWIKAVREHAHRMAEVGETPDGWKLVDKRAVRKWAEDGPTEMFLTEVLGQSDSDIFSYKIKSPAQIEKIVGKGKIDHLVIAESSGTKLVRLSAAGQPVIPRDPKADFSTVET